MIVPMTQLVTTPISQFLISDDWWKIKREVLKLYKNSNKSYLFDMILINIHRKATRMSSFKTTYS